MAVAKQLLQQDEGLACGLLWKDAIPAQSWEGSQQATPDCLAALADGSPALLERLQLSLLCPDLLMRSILSSSLVAAWAMTSLYGIYQTTHW